MLQARWCRNTHARSTFATNENKTVLILGVNLENKIMSIEHKCQGVFVIYYIVVFSSALCAHLSQVHMQVYTL